MSYFLIERLMGLFWVGVQQFCFTCLKYAHDDIVLGDGKARKLLVFQLSAFALLVVFCFEPELGAFAEAKFFVAYVKGKLAKEGGGAS